MSEAKHTPGPWVGCKNGQCQCGQIFGYGGNVYVATAHNKENTDELGMPDPHPTLEVGLANVRLIAAAPIPQDLYDSEINFEIEPFWDGGFYVRIGDHINGYKAEGDCQSYVEALEQLRDWGIIHYPNSDFAKQYDPTGEKRTAIAKVTGVRS